MQFNEQYYMNGKAAGISNYENYHWMPEQTIKLANGLMKLLSVQNGDTILDFGCARGYLVKALRILGVSAEGCDISEWAIANCDPDVRDYVSLSLPYTTYNHIISKDVLEHMTASELMFNIRKLSSAFSKSLFIIVPLSKEHDGEYMRVEDEMDVTHKIRWTFSDWMEYLQDQIHGSVLGSTHIDGLKPASKQVPGSTGFFLIKR